MHHRFNFRSRTVAHAQKQRQNREVSSMTILQLDDVVDLIYRSAHWPHNIASTTTAATR
jgi:hypothetical protein